MSNKNPELFGLNETIQHQKYIARDALSIWLGDHKTDEDKEKARRYYSFQSSLLNHLVRLRNMLDAG